MQFHVIVASNGSPERTAELARLAEDHGFAGIWVSNMHDGRDPFVNFVDAARATQTIRIGPVAVSPYELHPLKMGNALLTLNEIADGRAHIGISAGDGGTAFAMGMAAEHRLTAVRECVEIIGQMASGEMVRYQGRMYMVRWYHASWVSQPPPAVYVCAGGPQMLRSSARYAQGIYLGDHLPEHVAAVRETIAAGLAGNPHREAFRLLNFWAWHVKEDPEAALAEARMWLAARVTPWPAYYHRGILPDDEMQVIWNNTAALNRAFYAQDANIPEIPREILDKMCRRCAAASSVDELDVEIARLQEFAAAGLTDICIRIYEDPERSIRLLGERVIPAVDG